MSTQKSMREERVVDAAVEVFTRYGYTRTTMADIAVKAGMSRPALYLLFPDKEAIFARAIRSVDERKLAEITAALASIEGTTEKLLHACLDWALHGIELAAEHPDAADLFDLRFPAVRQAYSNFERLVSNLIADAVTATDIGATADELARMLVYGMRGSREAAADMDDMRRLVTLQVRSLVRAIGIADQATRRASRSSGGTARQVRRRSA